MKKSMREAIEGQTIENLKKRKEELHRKILQKQQLISKYKHLILQIFYNCSDLILEYEMIDRTVFFREKRVKILPPCGVRKKKEVIMPIEKSMKDLTREEASVLLEQLLAVRRDREIKDSEETSIKHQN